MDEGGTSPILLHEPGRPTRRSALALDGRGETEPACVPPPRKPASVSRRLAPRLTTRLLLAAALIELVSLVAAPIEFHTCRACRLESALDFVGAARPTAPSGGEEVEIDDRGSGLAPAILLAASSRSRIDDLECVTDGTRRVAIARRLSSGTAPTASLSSRVAFASCTDGRACRCAVVSLSPMECLDAALIWFDPAPPRRRRCEPNLVSTRPH